MGFPDSSVGKESAYNMQETPARFLGQDAREAWERRLSVGVFDRNTMRTYLQYLPNPHLSLLSHL